MLAFILSLIATVMESKLKLVRITGRVESRLLRCLCFAAFHHYPELRLFETSRRVRVLFTISTADDCLDLAPIDGNPDHKDNMREVLLPQYMLGLDKK